MIRYVSGVSSTALKAIAHKRKIGLLVQPGNSLVLQATKYPFWAADNGCFSQGEFFDTDQYLVWLAAHSDLADSCIFATAPDVVGDMVKTWRRSERVIEPIRKRGYKAALVAQNGLRVDDDELRICVDDRLPATFTGTVIPWDAFDVLFIGGDDRYKLGMVRQHMLCDAAKRHGKHVHMGRVNSYARLQQAQHFGADTADGTYLAFAARNGQGQDVAVAELERWLDQLYALHPAGGG